MSSTSVFPVRATVVRDAKAISDLYAQVALETYQSLLGTDQLPPLGQDKRQAYWREAIEFAEPQVMAAMHGERIVGFVGFDRSRDTGTPPTTGEIWVIQVLRSHWGQGAGLALWDAAREGLIEEGCTQVTAWVPLRNELAIRFHELAGFKRDMSTAKTVVVGSVRREEVRLSRPLA